jgi:hypothetical protein
MKTSMRGTFERYDGVDFLKDKLHVSVEINGEIYPVGVFCVTTESPRKYDGREVVELEAYSLLYILMQCKLETARVFTKGTAYMTVIQTLLNEAGLERYDIEQTTLTLATDRADWEIGTPFLTVINDLLDEINYNELWVSNAGTIRATKYTSPDISSVKHRYIEGETSLIVDAYTLTNDYYDKANVFIALCDNPEMDAVLRAEAVNEDPLIPYSTVNLGRRVPRIEYVDNTPSQDELQKYANRMLSESKQTNEKLEFRTAIDPTHTPYETVLVQVGNVAGIYRETGFEITLAPNGQMSHIAERVMM